MDIQQKINRLRKETDRKSARLIGLLQNLEDSVKLAKTLAGSESYSDMKLTEQAHKAEKLAIEINGDMLTISLLEDAAK